MRAFARIYHFKRHWKYEFNFLGLSVDQHLTWNEHVQKYQTRYQDHSGFVQIKTFLLSQQVLRILYKSLILSHLQNCILTWGFKSDRLVNLQKRAARISTCSKYNAHTEPLLKALNLLKIEDIMKIKALKSYHRYKQNEVQNILIQCSLNQMIIIHLILDINLFYINYHQRRALGGYV